MLGRSRGVRRISCLVAVLGLLVTAPAEATVGGPSRVEWIGWDAEGGALVWVVRRGGECEPCGYSVFRQVLDAGTPAERVRLATGGLRALRRRAVPIAPRWRLGHEPRPTLAVTGARSEGRLRLSVDVRDGPRHGAVELAAVRRRPVGIVGVAEVPGRAERIAVVRWVGIAVEIGYDDETVLVLRERG